MAARRSFLQTAGVWTAAALGAGAAPGQDGPRRPNILFIMADDHTSQAWGCYGSRLAPYAPTNHIDGLARDGALLRNCFCTNSICVPSRACIMTGAYSHIHGATTLKGGLRPEQDNVAKQLQAAGYGTALVGKWHLKHPPSGFDHYTVLRGQGRYHDPILFAKGENWMGKGTVHEGHSTDVITDQALAWLRQRDPDRPFCLFCHFKAVHEPFYSHERYRELLAGVQLPEPEDLLWPESPRNKVFPGWPLETLTSRFTRKPTRYSPPVLNVDGMDGPTQRRATYRKFVKDYLRTVAGIDDNIGRLLGWLDEAGLRDDTVVIYTSDQGYFLGEHNLFDKRFMLEESLRMPFVVRFPREIVAGTVVEDLILNIDFPELFLDYAGAPVPDDMQGRSFRANLQGRTPVDWREAIYYHYWTNDRPRPAHCGVRTKRWKLICYYGAARFGRRLEDCWELYDLQTDPHEHENVYGRPEHAAVISELKQTLADLRQEFGDTFEMALR